MHLLTIDLSGDLNTLIAIIIIVAGFVLGSLSAALARRFASDGRRPEGVRSSASAIATLAFSMILILALVIALGILNREALDRLSSDLVSFLPRALSAAIVLILGNVVGAIAETGVERSLGHVAPAVRARVPGIVKWGVSGFAIIIAANQLGIDTTIITVAVAAIFFSVGLALALLAGLGGRQVAQKIAAGRALRQVLSVGDRVSLGSVNGVVAAIGSTTTQVTSASGVILLPNDEVLSSQLGVVPKPEDDTDDVVPGAQ